ncbi:MAG: dihydrofolate reductase family protein, partial [Pseudomonadota bacterium]
QDGATLFDDMPGAAEVVRLKTVGGAIWLPALAEELVARGITRVLVEGGPTIWQAMATARMVDEVVVFRALGPDGVHEAVEKTLEKQNTQAAGLYFKVTDVRRLGPDVMMVFRPGANATA